MSLVSLSLYPLARHELRIISEFEHYVREGPGSERSGVSECATINGPNLPKNDQKDFDNDASSL